MFNDYDYEYHSRTLLARVSIGTLSMAVSASVIVTSLPASQRVMTSLVCSASPPKTPLVGEARMYAASSRLYDQTCCVGIVCLCLCMCMFRLGGI